jgi:tellurite resistance protein TerC
VFGAFLIFTGFKLFFAGAPKDPSDNIAVRVFRKLVPFREGYDGKRFFSVVDGKRAATTLFLVLICIEFTDLVFALDSIPAIFGITRDPFIVFTSNVFAILGLRSMYFLLAGVMDKFHLLKYGLAVILAFVGAKMLLPGAAELYSHMTNTNHYWEIDKFLSLAVIIAALAVSIFASLLFPSRTRHANPLADEEAPSDKLAPPGFPPSSLSASPPPPTTPAS